MWESASSISKVSISRHFHGLPMSPPTFMPRYSSLQRSSLVRTASGWRNSESSAFVPKAIHCMVGAHPRRLHEGVADGRTYKVETALLEILAHRIRLGCMRRDLTAQPPAIHARLAADKLPDVAIERTELLLHFKKRPRVGNRRLNLQPVANNPLIATERDRNSCVSGNRV